MHLVHCFSNETLMGIIFATDNCSQEHNSRQITLPYWLPTLSLNKGKAVVETWLSPSHLIYCDSSL